MKEYLQFCDFKNKIIGNELYLSCCDWFFPTQLLPLSVFIKANNDLNVISPKSKSVSKYLLVIRKNKVCEDKSYLPIMQLPSREDFVNESLKKFYASNNLGKEYGGENAFKYTIGELVDNVYQHSKFKNAFVMALVSLNKPFLINFHR